MHKTIVVALLGGLVGGTIVWIGQAGTFHLSPVGMTYSNLAALMLAAVAVLVTVLGVFIAILAIWGYSQFKNIAQGAAKEHVGNQLKDGGDIRAHIEKVVESFLAADFKSGNLRKLIEERLDYVIYSDAAQRAAAAAAEADKAQDEIQDDDLE